MELNEVFMTKKDDTSLYVEEQGFWAKIGAWFTMIWGKVKNFFYDANCAISAFFAKIFGKRKQTVQSGNVGAAIFAHTLVIYPILQFLVFYVYVNFNSIILSLQQYNLETGQFTWLGIDNFKQVIIDIVNDSTMKYCVSNSLTAYAIGLIVGFPLNLTFAYVIYKKIPASGFFQIVLFLPQILSSIVISMMFMTFVRNVVPAVMNLIMKPEEIFTQFGQYTFPDLLHHPSTKFPMMIFYSLWAGFGSQLILYSGAMSRIPDSIIEYGELEGITLLKEFWYVCIPMTWSTITIFLVTGVAGIFSSQLALYNFYGKEADPIARTLGYHFFIMVLGEEARYIDYPYASAAGILFTLVAAPVTLVARNLLEKYGPQVEF